MPLFDELGLVRDVKPSRLTDESGIFWVCSENHSAFVGVADNLRLQIDSYIEQLGETATPEWVSDRPTTAVRMRMLPMGDANRSTMELMRSSILRRQGSRLNFKDASLFGGLLVLRKGVDARKGSPGAWVAGNGKWAIRWPRQCDLGGNWR